MTTPAPAPSFTNPGEAAAFAQYRAAQIEEYGTYIAAHQILVGNTPAFGAGHPVPKSTAEAMGWDRDGTCVPAGTQLPVAPIDRQAQLRARAEEIERERRAIEIELSAGAATDYTAMTVIALRDLLATRQLPTSGNKDELITRLQAADNPTEPIEPDSGEE